MCPSAKRMRFFSAHLQVGEVNRLYPGKVTLSHRGVLHPKVSNSAVGERFLPLALDIGQPVFQFLSQRADPRFGLDGTNDISRGRRDSLPVVHKVCLLPAHSFWWNNLCEV